MSLLTHILGDIWGNFWVNCLNFTENIANFKGHQCLWKDIRVKKGPSLTFLRDKENLAVSFVCLYRGFMAQSTQWSHWFVLSSVSLPNHMFTGKA